MVVSKYALAGLLWTWFAAASWATDVVITISTNNTPSERKALEALSREALRRLGLELRLIVQPSERSLKAADDGMVDAEGLRVAGLSERYPNLVRVPERYVSTSFVAFARRDSTIALDEGWASIKPHRVAFMRGCNVFETHARDARIVTRVNDPKQMFLMLDGGRIDLALYRRIDGTALLRRLDLSSIVALEPSLSDRDLYLYLNGKHRELVQPLVEVLRRMKMDGTHKRILGSIASD